MLGQVKIFFALAFIVFAIEAKPYKGAEYRTIETYTYGRFETSYKPPQSAGCLASFFTYHEINSLSEWNEIDIEILGRYTNDVQVASIGPSKRIRNSHQWVPFEPQHDFHTYAFEWTPDYIAWFIDDVEIYRQTGEHIAEFNLPQKLMMNIWPPNGTDWDGELNDDALPLFAYYDYASYAAYTPGSGDSGSDNNFTLIWYDDFDQWDQSRWEKASHTFGDNQADFEPENAVIQDGMLILCLTKESPLGYIDQTPPSAAWARGNGQTITIRFTEKVDSVSSQDAGNYNIGGGTIQQAVLRSDMQTVDLQVTGTDSLPSGNVVIQHVKDLHGNAITVDLVLLTRTKPLSFPIKINVGDTSYADFLEDRVWDPRNEYGHQSGYPILWPQSLEIANTAIDHIYQSALREIVNYKIRLPNGLYNLTLMMSENDTSVASNPRIQSIHAENVEIASRLNLAETAGYYTAYELVAENISVTDGILDIHFTNYSNLSILNGLIVEQVITVVDHPTGSTPEIFTLNQNYPNPFNPETTISFSLGRESELSLTVYDVAGRKIKELFRGEKSAGQHTINFNGSDLSSGIYYYRLNLKNENKNRVITKKMILLK